jgi:hypothetical protein
MSVSLLALFFVLCKQEKGETINLSLTRLPMRRIGFEPMAPQLPSRQQGASLCDGDALSPCQLCVIVMS